MAPKDCMHTFHTGVEVSVSEGLCLPNQLNPNQTKHLNKQKTRFTQLIDKKISMQPLENINAVSITSYENNCGHYVRYSDSA